MYAEEIPASRFVELCLGVVVSEISPRITRTPYFLKNFTNNFFFSPLAVHNDILDVSMSLTETVQT
jgi:hypothetical protein